MVSLQKFGRVYVLTLLGDNDHRFTQESCLAIFKALETVNKADDAGALVTTNEGKFFSNGLDLDWARRGPAGMENTVDLDTLLAALVDINVPTIAAVCGHAAAGGFIFALAHDHRCMRSDRGFLYMSELDVQVRITAGSMAVIRASLSPKAMKDSVLLGRKQTAKEALDAGIVDSIHESSAKTLEAAIALATQLSNRGWDRNLYRNMRLDMHPGTLEEIMKGIESGSRFKEHPPSRL